MLHPARAYLADVVEVALSVGTISPKELNHLKQLGYIRPAQPGWPQASASHLELEAEVTIPLDRRLGTRVEGVKSAAGTLTD
jgi:hypothetical protein